MVKSKIPKIKVPVLIEEDNKYGYKIGEVVNYPNKFDSQLIEYRDNFTFEAFLKVKGISRGTSSATFELSDVVNEVEYTMFMKDMLEMINNSILDGGYIFGKFTYCKRGSNYGIKLVEQLKIS